MPAFTYERAWHFSQDNANTPASALDESNYTAWAMLSMLVGGLGGLTLGLWTIYTTSDGTAPGTGTTGDGVDHLHLLGSFTTGDWLHNTAGNAHSWAVIKSPTMNGTNFYLTFSFDSATTSVATTKISKNAPTGGTNTANPVPSPDDSFNWGKSSQDAWVGGNTNAHRYSISLSETGDFIFYWTRAGQGKHEGAFCGIAPMGCHADDLWPIWTFRSWVAASFAFNGQNIVGSSGPMITKDFKNATSSTQTIAVCERSAQLLTSNDSITGRVQDQACWLIIHNTGCWHHRGRLPDIVYCGLDNSLTTPAFGNTVKDGSAVIKAATVGSLVIPVAAAPNLT